VLVGDRVFRGAVHGRYPRGIFGFNVGVLRWSWRVAFYTFGALGTTSTRRSRSRTCPSIRRGSRSTTRRTCAAASLSSGGGCSASRSSASRDLAGAGWSLGLVGILVLVAGVLLLFKDRYPTEIFDLVLGLNRWVLRVVAYAAFMTREYPPFRFDARPA
jgi:hypothetical protein